MSSDASTTPQKIVDSGDSTRMTLLQQGAERLGLSLTAEQLGQFDLYARALVEWNHKFNLTAITEPDAIQTKHFLDSLAGLPIVLEELGETLPLQKAKHLVDVGTGAGFPGIPLKIAAPRLKLTLIDGTSKKIKFLTHLVAKLGLDDVSIVQGRAEELGRQTTYRGQYDLVTARAVAPLNTLVEYLLPLVRRGGLAVIYKGANVATEFMEARHAIDVLGSEMARLAPVDVPMLDQKRHILVIKKVRRSPNLYPRGQGLARKRPL